MKSHIALILISFVITPLFSNEVPQTVESKQRIEEVSGVEQRLIRFYDREGKKIKDMEMGDVEMLMNRPLTAQLPGGNGGNHKDKSEVKESTETINTENDEIEINTSTLRFVGRDGKLHKEIPLKTQTTRERVKTNENNDLEIEISHSKTPVISKNKKFILINRKTHKVPVDRKRLGEYAYSESDEIELYGTDGEVIYKKVFVEDAGFSDAKRQIAVADTGAVAFILEGNPMRGNYWTKLYVYDKNGTLILSYPDDKTVIRNIYPDGMDISPNGRYLSIRVGFPYPDPIVTVFFDLKLKKWWKAKLSHVVYAISDTGIAITDYPNPNIPDNADRKKVKEPLRIREDLDLKKYFGE